MTLTSLLLIGDVAILNFGGGGRVGNVLVLRLFELREISLHLQCTLRCIDPLTVLFSCFAGFSTLLYEPLSSADLRDFIGKDDGSSNCGFVHDQFAIGCDEWDAKFSSHNTAEMRYHGLFANSKSGQLFFIYFLKDNLLHYF